MSALRVAALWLLVVSVFFGPAGLGGSLAFASGSKTCGASCPCDKASHDDCVDDQDEHAVAPDPCTPEQKAEAEAKSDSPPCEDQCPDDCPNCGCCHGVAMAVLPLPIPSAPLPSTPVRMMAPPDAAAIGARTAVFRPPRPLT